MVLPDPECPGSYQQGVAASHDAQAQPRASLADVYGGLAAGDDGTGGGVAGQGGRRGRAALGCGRTRVTLRWAFHLDDDAWAKQNLQRPASASGGVGVITVALGMLGSPARTASTVSSASPGAASSPADAGGSSSCWAEQSWIRSKPPGDGRRRPLTYPFHVSFRLRRARPVHAALGAPRLLRCHAPSLLLNPDVKGLITRARLRQTQGKSPGGLRHTPALTGFPLFRLIQAFTDVFLLPVTLVCSSELLLSSCHTPLTGFVLLSLFIVLPLF